MPNVCQDWSWRDYKMLCQKVHQEWTISNSMHTHTHTRTSLQLVPSCSISVVPLRSFKIVLHHVPVLVLLQSSKPHVFPACANSLLVVGSRTARRCAKAVKEKHFMSRTSAFRNSQTSRTNLQLLLFWIFNDWNCLREKLALEFVPVRHGLLCNLHGLDGNCLTPWQCKKDSKKNGQQFLLKITPHRPQRAFWIQRKYLLFHDPT